MKKEKQHSILSNLMFIAGYYYKYSKKAAIGLFITIFDFVEVIYSIYLPKLVIDLAQCGQPLGYILIRLSIISAIFILLMLTGSYFSINTDKGGFLTYIKYPISTYIGYDVIKKSQTCDYSLIESSKGQLMMQKAMYASRGGDWGAIIQMMRTSIQVIIDVICLLLFLGIIAKLNILIMLTLFIVALINAFVLSIERKYRIKMRDEIAKNDKKFQYVQRITDKVENAKDIRIYSMAGFFGDKLDGLLFKQRKLHMTIEKHCYISKFTANITLFIRDLICYTYLIASLYNGTISLGDFMLYFGTITMFANYFEHVIVGFGTIIDSHNQINEIRKFMDTTSSADPENPQHISNKAKNLSIEFRNVSFSYDGKTNVLENFNLKINSGEKIALVGVNGAGKTSIVKLICGFYKPASGQILINGIDMRNIPRDEIFTLYSTVFQDITIFPISIAENISMRTIEDTDMDKVVRCLKKADLYDAIIKYPKGIMTYMTNLVEDDGITLSGGQQQKLLMARALYKDSPAIILDEPTAALDPIAEDETYRMFHSIVGEKTAIYISHRLASTRFCDRIALLKDGSICEIGTHLELMELEGEYAKMFDLQSEYYSKGTKEVQA